MATTSDDSQEQQAGKERQESLWASFTRADMKLFPVTFAGTVAANIVTAMIVAVAIILVRSTTHSLPIPVVMIYVLVWVVFGLVTVASA